MSLRRRQRRILRVKFSGRSNFDSFGRGEDTGFVGQLRFEIFRTEDTDFSEEEFSFYSRCSSVIQYGPDGDLPQQLSSIHLARNGTKQRRKGVTNVQDLPTVSSPAQ